MGLHYLGQGGSCEGERDCTECAITTLLDGHAGQVRHTTVVDARQVSYIWRLRSSTDESVDKCKKFTEELVKFVRAKNAELSGRDLGCFLNMSQGDEDPKDVFGANLLRLQKIKAKYDPSLVWSKGITIQPSKE